jgi:hypothetical protein
VTQSYEHTWAFIAALAGDPAKAVVDWRALHDADKSVPGHARRGTLPDWWQWLCEMNNAGYGIFCTIAAMDGNGRELTNVDYLRAVYIDNDGIDAQAQAERAATMQPAPGFAVASSPGKTHTYWPVQPFRGNDRFTVIQRKLRQLFNGDRAVIDAARVMRVPGTYNTKYSNPASAKHIPGTPPHLVTIEAREAWGQWHAVESLEHALSAVNVIDGGNGERHELGDPDLAAPSLDWLERALALTDPNALSRNDWIAFSAAFKQAGWSLTDPATLRGMWDEWCTRYTDNDPAENDKQWRSLTRTELGWASLVRRVPSLNGLVTFGGKDRSGQIPVANHNASPPGDADISTVPPMPDMSAPPALDCTGEYLTHVEQQTWFKGCVFIVSRGLMLAPNGRFLGVTAFNAAYGGKQFIVDGVGKKTNEAWAAATRSTLWTVPKVDHSRFVPHRAYQEIISDDLGRDGVNVYKPAVIRRAAGDPSPFLNHIGAILPTAQDQQSYLNFLAHNAKFPGHKIPWAPVIQSAEGVGKGIIKLLVMHMMGRPYVYFPNAQQLVKSGAQFNAWMRHKLFILADEIKVDERRDLIEILKPMISEAIIEVQGKGDNQDLEDNYSNWQFFTNYKDAVPINKNGRRYAVYYSPIQTVDDLLARGMDDTYFNALYGWMEGEGAAIVTDYLMNYPIKRGEIAMRAPETSSTAAAVEMSRSPIERAILDAVHDGLQGFRAGWISSLAVVKHLRDVGAVSRAVQPSTIRTIVESLGYVSCGRAPRAWLQEDAKSRADLYHWGQAGDVNSYGRSQGYE